MKRRSDRRRHPRAPFQAWVEMAARDRRFLGKGRDLSQGGIGVWVEGPAPEEGAVVESEFQLPGIQLPVMLRSRVAWRDGASCELGVGFIDMDPAVAELIQNFVAGRLQDA